VHRKRACRAAESMSIKRPVPKTLIAPQQPAPRIVAIGVSTGGPAALANIIPCFPRDFALPVLIVQHMPPLFARLLCDRLRHRSKLAIREAVHGEIIEPGRILLAPGDFHMKVAGGPLTGKILLDQSPPQNSCRPAVDALFLSLAEVFGGSVIAAVLTGMGRDGLLGAAALKARGAHILAQDEATSAVWGMPRAIVEAELADAVLPLDKIVPQILSRSPGKHRPVLDEAHAWRR